MSQDVQLEELLAIEPFSTYESILGRIPTAKVDKVIEHGETLRANTLLLIDVDGLDNQSLAEEIKNAYVTGVKMIMLTGTKAQISLPTGCKALFRDHLFVFYLNQSVTKATLMKMIDFISQLKAQDMLFYFIESASGGIASIINQIGIEDYLTAFRKRTRHGIYVTNEWFEPLFEGDAVRTEDEIRRLNDIKHVYFQTVSKDQQLFVDIRSQSNEAGCTIYKLMAKNHLLGFYILLENETTVSAVDRAQMKCFSSILIAEVLKKNEQLANERKLQKVFIYDLLNNNFDSLYTMIHQAKTWQWDLSKQHHLLILEMKMRDENQLDQDKIDYTISLVSNAMTRLFYRPIIMDLNDHIVLLFTRNENRPEHQAEIRLLANRLIGKMAPKIDWATLSFGIGRLYPSASDLCRSYQEAKMALQLGQLVYHKKPVFHFDDLGVIKLLASLRQELLKEFSDEYLAALRTFDKANATNMIETLQIYLVENGNLKTTADQLYIHTNTLRNRLKKIESVLDINLQESEAVVNVSIALKINAMNSAW